MKSYGKQTTVLRVVSYRLADWGLPTVLIFALHIALIRRAGAEDRMDLKTLLYSEGSDRMQIISPTFKIDKQFGLDTAIKLDGIYNSISGATPTGAPIPRYALPAPALTFTEPAPVAPAPVAVAPRPAPATVTVQPRPAPAPVYREDEHEEEDEDERREEEHEEDDKLRSSSMKRILTSKRAFLPYVAKAGATPQPQPQPRPRPQPQPAPAPAPRPAPQPAPRPVSAPAVVVQTPPTPAAVETPQAETNAPPQDNKSGKVPKANVEDERIGFNLDFSRRFGRHTLGVQLSYSTEADYESLGLSLRDGIDFNQRNTTLTVGGAFTHDLIDAPTMDGEETKDSVDAMIGLSQTISARTLLTMNFSYGHVSGFLSDPYKVVELNDELVPERRPDTKDKMIVYAALTRAFPFLRGSAEISYRWYDDSYGVHADTYGLAWYQKMGPYFIVRPAVRYYRQTEADFYAYRFEGTPEFYSSDYRVSAFDSMGYGLKIIWKPFRHFSMDAAIERYEQKGMDGVTPGDVYPVSTLILIGVQVPM